MTEYQITFWRDLPATVTARNPHETVDEELPSRFLAAIDEAALRLGESGAEDYQAGWTRGEWVATPEAPATACAMVTSELEAEWSPQVLAEYLDDLGPAAAAS